MHIFSEWFYIYVPKKDPYIITFEAVNGTENSGAFKTRAEGV